jgi:hypothetical protein
MSTTAYPHESNDCESCAAFDVALTADVLDDEGEVSQRSRWCERCAGPLLARLVLQGRTAIVGPSIGPVAAPPRRESSVVDEVRRRRAGGRQFSTWTVEFAEQVLRQAKPSASEFVRALVDEGGQADVETLKQRTGSDTLHYMTLTLNTAARALWIGPLPDGGSRLFVARPLHDPDIPRDKKVRGYALPAEHVPIWAEALTRLGR